MNLIVYTLNVDGSIPDYVIDGGYLALNNGGTSPQDLDLIGVSTNNTDNRTFATKTELLNYVTEKKFVFENLASKQSMSASQFTDILWSKI